MHDRTRAVRRRCAPARLRVNGLDARRHAMLDCMGVTVWVSRTAPAGVATTDAAAGMPLSRAYGAAAAVIDDSSGTLASLSERVAACTACALHGSRTQTVFGVGAAGAPLMVIGEAPGAEEDKRGEPFVGRAGQLLNAMLAAIGYAREQVYIANILKCRPPRNRDPQADEVDACRDYLDRQIALVGPRVILAVGRIAAQNLLAVDTPIGRMRGHDYTHAASGTPVVVTYHPAYLLRSPGEKRKAWDDLQRVAQCLRAGVAA